MLNRRPIILATFADLLPRPRKPAKEWTGPWHPNERQAARSRRQAGFAHNLEQSRELEARCAEFRRQKELRREAQAVADQRGKSRGSSRSRDSCAGEERSMRPGVSLSSLNLRYQTMAALCRTLCGDGCTGGRRFSLTHPHKGTITDLLELTVQDVRAIQGIGPVGLQQIRKELSDRGLVLRGETYGDLEGLMVGTDVP